MNEFVLLVLLSATASIFLISGACAVVWRTRQFIGWALWRYATSRA